MVLKLSRFVVVAVLVAIALSSIAPQAGAQSPVGYNYYVQPSGTCLGSSLYPCPRPTPAPVSDTYITYQALNPHEFLYPHNRTYYTQHPSGVTRTMVSWGWSILP